MNLADLRAALGNVPRYIAAAAIIVATAILLASTCNRAARLTAEVEQLREAARLRAAGVTVAEPATIAELRRQAARIPGLEAELARVHAAAPDAQPTSVAHLTTGAIVAAGKPRPGRVPTAALADVRPPGYAPNPSEPEPSAPPSSPPAEDSGATASGACLLAAGDPSRIDLDEVRLEAAGATAVVGTASAYRLDPAGAQRILTGPVHGTLSVAPVGNSPTAVAAPRWGAGPFVGLLPGGAVAGALVAPPRLRVPWLGWELEPLVGGGVGPGGWVLVGSALVRP